MGRSRKIQLKAMNAALINHATTESKRVGLSSKDIVTVKQNAYYNQPYNNIEVLKSNKIYSTTIDLSKNISKSIDDIQKD